MCPAFPAPPGLLLSSEIRLSTLSSNYVGSGGGSDGSDGRFNGCSPAPAPSPENCHNHHHHRHLQKSQHSHERTERAQSAGAEGSAASGLGAQPSLLSSGPRAGLGRSASCSAIGTAATNTTPTIGASAGAAAASFSSSSSMRERIARPQQPQALRERIVGTDELSDVSKEDLLERLERLAVSVLPIRRPSWTTCEPQVEVIAAPTVTAEAEGQMFEAGEEIVDETGLKRATSTSSAQDNQPPKVAVHSPLSRSTSLPTTTAPIAPIAPTISSNPLLSPQRPSLSFQEGSAHGGAGLGQQPRVQRQQQQPLRTGCVAAPPRMLPSSQSQLQSHHFAPSSAKSVQAKGKPTKNTLNIGKEGKPAMSPLVTEDAMGWICHHRGPRLAKRRPAEAPSEAEPSAQVQPAAAAAAAAAAPAAAAAAAAAAVATARGESGQVRGVNSLLRGSLREALLQ